VSSPGSWERDDARTVAYFTERLAQHGDTPRSVDWGSVESQRLRFAALLDIGVRSGDSLIDVGCGTGALLDYLQEKHIDVDYRGYDLTPSMIDLAKSRHPKVNFAVCNVIQEKQIEPADYVIASGIFYLRQERPVAFLEAMVGRLWQFARRGVAINCLSAWAAERDPNEFYADPAEALAIARRISSHVVLRHDYHPRDFTIYLRREAWRPF